ncbi:MAG TPA: hypothetical protein QGF95_18765 [Candidatus Latescibacteria bacterium]|nr:hypothetical protein [Gemmatimonadaceae bacterium]MDP6015430.1 hypothetical protein [Candidatus Latescibacterota bacterium]HJP32591.1 hypothetical protein [Candidatus Latescibacterota bacterium]
MVENHDSPGPVQVEVGDIISIQIVADFQARQASGLAAYLTVPEAVFLVEDLGPPGQQGTQPFRPGPLFDGAVLPTNILLPDDDGVAAAIAGQQLDLAALFGLGSAGETGGAGVVATFRMVALHPVAGAVIRIDDSPIRETRVVLSDGRSERRFASTRGVAITVVDPVATAIVDRPWGRLKTTTARYLTQAAGPW